MKINRRAFTGLMGTALLGLGLAACGSGSGSSDGGATTFVIWDYEGDSSAQAIAWNRAVEIFKERHPEVEVTMVEQTFEQLQKNAKIVLTGDDVPDVMEFNKGNSTSGQLASQGLIAPLTDYAAQYGWDSTLPASIQTTARYTEAGLMGDGDWYGVPNYGEYVFVYYNKDMFEQAGLTVPTTLEELEAVCDAFVAQGITPFAEAGSEYPMGQLWYQLVLTQADRDFVNAYELFQGDADWSADPIKAGTDRLVSWIGKGYVAADSAGLTAEDAGASFIAGTYPMFVSGSWWFGRMVADITGFEWDQFLFPGTTLYLGSSGNLWVVPTNAKNPDLAAEFIDITLSEEVQAVFAQHGGLPVLGETSSIEDDKTRVMTENFQEILDGDGLAFYPDWPVAGFYDQIVSAMQSLINGSKTGAEAMADLAAAYEEGKADILDA
ncbi:MULTISPECIES: extracellular solute-binding protein [unclassified Actinomyces]|uniref:ABC transporter substrate-binding protein n=1 Tax=unclassified Actinomyces TaxID=2609248 RepID=UPI00201769D6|nr:MULTISPECIES: extracellular solute-binding protein [unclassified Actinomyces]MCL3777361.1 extracellular solute-binding protein [Actinomyces sp. AC-20-1]MCL3789330.1 extracellular solute-binding protein [Actinomyces sp. 187325]MCL3792530.1 extracellular solute-binding protein [Actinomyces sp. 186855]MCL3793997.1 extracellular solute-binding protein [Actinomyces sp. 217892]